jgi:tRNA-splicing ligase RtcB
LPPPSVPNVKSIKEEIIERLTKEGRQQEIHEALREIKKPVIPSK